MRRSIVAAFGTVLVAVAAWWVLPWQSTNGKIDLAMLGPPHACACAAMPSPPLRTWLACAVTELDKVRRLDEAVIENNVGHLYDIEPKDVPARFNTAIHDVVEGKCGTFERALAQANDLQERRRSVGYEEYFIIDTAAEMFVNWSAEDLRNQANDPIPKVGANDA